MNFDHRKLRSLAIIRRDKGEDSKTEKIADKDYSHGGDMIRRSILIAASIITAFFFLCLVIMISKRYLSHRRRIRNRLRRPINTRGGESDDAEIFVDEDRGPMAMTVDHPIWYINTVGLPRHVIDSIAIVKYGKDAGFVDCSVCLSEFEEDESVRVLPKCDHAFHVACIDTWLASHKNCPLCRAPIVCENADESTAEESPPLETEEGESSRTGSDSAIGDEDDGDGDKRSEVSLNVVTNSKRVGSSGGLSIYRQVMNMRSYSMKRPSSSSSSSSLSISKHRRTQSSIIPS